MSGGSDGNKEFTEQLRMQQLYDQSHEAGSDPTYTDPDGTVYDWNHDKKAWFPKITEDFIATYQANYGFTKDGEPDANAAVGDSTAPQGREVKAPEKVIPDPATESKQKGEKRKPDPGWFDVEEDKNTNVYVSGLPLDISTEEFVELMSKCGIMMRDPVTEEYKVKLYKDAQGNLKGDGLCCYLKKESVALALRLIDESELRGYKLHVEAAQFELKGKYDASKKKKKGKEHKKKMQQQQKQLDWRPEKQGEVRKRHEKVIIIQNMFHPSDFEEDPLVLNEYREDLRTECEKFGQVKKVIIFDRHPDGVASVAFKEPEHGDACLQALDGRWFGGRKLSAQPWDGTTDYQVDETTREREERLKGWATFLDEAKKDGEQSANLTEPPGGATSTELPGGATSTEPAGGATSTEPAGGATSTEPAGGATSTEPAGGATSTEPAGGATSTEPAGGANSTEPAGGATSTEPPVQPPVTTEPGSEPGRTASTADPDLVERTGNNPKTEPQPTEQQEEEMDSTDSSLAGSGDEEA